MVLCLSAYSVRLSLMDSLTQVLRRSDVGYVGAWNPAYLVNSDDETLNPCCSVITGLGRGRRLSNMANVIFSSGVTGCASSTPRLPSARMDPERWRATLTSP